MLGFFIKTVHSVLNFLHSLLPSRKQPAIEQHVNSAENNSHSPNPPSGLQIAIAGDEPRSQSVFQSVYWRRATGHRKLRVASGSGGTTNNKKNSAGAVMEAMSSISESLGFESTDILEHHQVPIPIQEHEHEDEDEDEEEDSRSKRTTSGGIVSDRRSEGAKNKVYPPVLDSLKLGRPTSFMKSVKKDGRLEIKEMKADRPEMICSSRQDGRLILHLVKPVQESGEASSSGSVYESGEASSSGSVQASVEEPVKSVEESVKEDEELEGGVEGGASEENYQEPKLQSGVGGGEGLRRKCYDVARRGYYNHGQHQVPIWSTHWVMTG